MNDETEIDFQEWAILLSQLLDQIEAANSDPEVHALLQVRFQIARQMGLEITFAPHQDGQMSQ